jgi:glycosyltransferase involved in cell wall biosynthesis
MMIPVSDADALAKIISSVIADKSLQRKLGQAAHQTITERFTLESELQTNLEIYRRLGI